jgi:hypothetical protein
MDHLRHAPETHGHYQPRAGTPISGGPAPGSFTLVRVEQVAGEDAELATQVPLDLARGVTTRLRVYREQSGQSDPYVTYQVAPDGHPLGPKEPDRSPPEDPLFLKHFFLGTVTVNLPDGSRFKSFLVSAGHGEAVRVDLTKGIDVACSLDYKTLTTCPVGPMLNIDVTPGGP